MALLWIAVLLLLFNGMRLYRGKYLMMERLEAPYLDTVPEKIREDHQPDQAFTETLAGHVIHGMEIGLPREARWNEMPELQEGVAVLRKQGGDAFLGLRTRDFDYTDPGMLLRHSRKIYYAKLNPKMLLAKKQKCLTGMVGAPAFSEQMIGPWNAFIIRAVVEEAGTDETAILRWDAVKFELIRGNLWVEVVFYMKEEDPFLNMNQMKDIVATIAKAGAEKREEETK